MNLRNIAVVLSANTGSFRSQLAMAAGDLEKFDKQAQKTGGGLARLSSMAQVAAKAGLLAFGVAMVASTAAAVQFETRMRNVNSISHLSEQAFRAQGDAVLEMSKTFPQSANKLAEGLYDIASSGFQAEKGMMVLEASAKAAAAGMTDTATSAKVITAVLNAYGLEAEDANRVGNVLFQGVNVGVMTFEELSGAIGNVVGTAAAAGVSIEDLTAGIATMTLSGISADEASTSMNRTLQGLIDPSDALASSIQALGYESGVSMLQTLGLHGTMEKLRTITGGNIEVLLRYFPEIRAARGALALMSAEGENYNKVQESMNDAQKDGGAMQATFREQMKSTSAQVTIVKNNVMAFAIAVGTQMLPYVRDGIKEIKGFTNEVIDLGREGKDRLEPFLTNLRPLLDNVGTLLGDVAEAGAPVAVVFAAIAAVGLIELLNGLSTVLVATTGSLVDHKEILAAVAAFYGVQLVASLFAAGGMFDVLALKAMYAAEAMSFAKVSAGISSLGSSLAGLVSPMGLVGIAAAGVAASLVLINRENERLSKLGKDSVQQWMDGFSSSEETFLSVSTQYGKIGDAIDEVDRQTKALKDDMSSADQVMEEFGFNETKHLKVAKEELTKLKKEYGGYLEVVKEVAFRLGISYEEANKLIAEQGIAVKDVATGAVDSEEKQSKAILKTVEAREQAIATEKMQLGQAGATQSELTRLAGLTGEEFEAEASRIMEAATAAEEFAKKVGDAWASQHDVVAALGSDVEVTGKKIVKWYDTMVTDGEKFSENIRKAIEMGYDANLIARVIEAGPAQAGPLLEQMVTNQGQHFVDSVNQSERALTELNKKAVELGRLTNRAMTADSDLMAANLDKAMKISTIIMANGGKTTMDALTHALGVGASEVQAIADQYGISLAAALDPVRAATGLGPIPRGRTQPRNALAEGGHIDPAVWGDTNADTVPAWLMPGEIVIKKKAVQKWGVDPLLDLNEGRMPAQFAARYAAGGLVTLGVPNYPPGHFGDTAEAASAQTYMKAVAQWSAAQSAAAAAGGGGGSLPGSVAEWVREAMRLTGTPETWFSALMARVRLESGGNPKAINLWDSNAKAGHPSKGLMQTIDGTFNRYKLPGHGDIWNPVDNAAAAIQYIKARYGTIFNINPRTGYAEGGQVQKLPYGKYDEGGFLPTGLSIAENRTGSPERVVGPRDAMPQISVNVNVFIGETQLRGMIRQEVMVEQDKKKRRDRSMASA